MSLPSVEECRTFLDTINRGREAIDLPVLTKLDFDNAEPSNGGNCLSARNLFAHAGLCVGWEHAWSEDDVVLPAHVAIAQALGTKVRDAAVPLPYALKAVTDPFDRDEAGLRERMVEAGVVDP